MEQTPGPVVEQLRPAEVVARTGRSCLEMIGGLVLGAAIGAYQGACVGAAIVRDVWHERAIDLQQIETFANDPTQHNG